MPFRGAGRQHSRRHELFFLIDFQPRCFALALERLTASRTTDESRRIRQLELLLTLGQFLEVLLVGQVDRAVFHTEHVGDRTTPPNGRVPWLNIVRILRRAIEPRDHVQNGALGQR